MQTVALRFTDNYAPQEGTILAHENLLKKKGYVWYGKTGNALSSKVISAVMKTTPAKILLIQTGTIKRQWIYVDDISREYPGDGEYPGYYYDKKNKVKTWFRIIKIENAPKDIMSKCIVVSSGKTLASASRHSMNPYFRIELIEEKEPKRYASE